MVESIEELKIRNCKLILNNMEPDQLNLIFFIAGEEGQTKLVDLYRQVHARETVVAFNMDEDYFRKTSG